MQLNLLTQALISWSNYENQQKLKLQADFFANIQKATDGQQKPPTFKDLGIETATAESKSLFEHKVNEIAFKLQSEIENAELDEGMLIILMG